MCLHVDNEDVNEIEVGRLKRKVKLQDTTAEREEICNEFSDRCKQVWTRNDDRSARIRYLRRKITVLSCHRCLI